MEKKDPELQESFNGETTIYTTRKAIDLPRKDPEHCVHFTVRRIINSWECLGCGAKFVPKNLSHRTKWSDDK